MKTSRVRIGIEIGLTVALSAVLSFFSPWQMPQGGSVSLSMLPIFVLAILRGWKPGIVAGVVYGVVDYWMEPYFFTPVQVLLDYPIAYALCGLAGTVSSRWHRLSESDRKSKALLTAIVPGIAVGSLGRYAAHVLSGIVFFSTYAVEAGQAPLVYSLAYNSFVIVSGVLCAVLAAAILPLLRLVVRRGA